MEKVIALLPWDITVRRSRTRRQAHELLESSDARAAIQALTEMELYYVVKELGMEDALPVLAELTPPQAVTLLDLEVWHGAEANLSDMILWLSALKEANPDRWYSMARALDPELLELLFRRRLYIALRPSEDEHYSAETPEWLYDPSKEILPLIETADRRFILAARPIDELDENEQPIDEDERKALLSLVDALYHEEDFDFVASRLHHAAAGLSSDLEEAAYHFRTSRLEDLGFPPLERAQGIYTPRSRGALLESEALTIPVYGEVFLPALHAQALNHGLFQEALLGVESPEIIRRIEGELLPLANSVLVADRVDPGDLAAIRTVLTRLRGYIELALGLDGDGEVRGLDPVEIARQRLEQHAVMTLFQVGFGVAVDLARRADRLRRGRMFAVGQGANMDMLSAPERAILATLEGRRPFIENAKPVCAVLEPLEQMAPEMARLCLAEVNEALDGSLEPALASERDIDKLLTTAAVGALLGRGFKVIPLDASDLEALALVLKEDWASVRTRVQVALQEALAAPAGAALAVRVFSGLEALRSELAVRVGPIDLRFVAGVIRRLPKVQVLEVMT